MPKVKFPLRVRQPTSPIQYPMLIRESTTMNPLNQAQNDYVGKVITFQDASSVQALQVLDHSGPCWCRQYKVYFRFTDSKGHIYHSSHWRTAQDCKRYSGFAEAIKDYFRLLEESSENAKWFEIKAKHSNEWNTREYLLNEKMSILNPVEKFSVLTEFDAFDLPAEIELNNEIDKLLAEACDEVLNAQ